MSGILSKSKSFIRNFRRRSKQDMQSIPNEAVNFNKQVIFIAVPKTGTTTVRSQLREKGTPLIPNPHLNIMQVRDTLYVYFLKCVLGRNTNFPTESVPEDSGIRARVQEVFDTFFKFSAVRNPWARAVSLFFRREGLQIKNRMSFEDFCHNHLYASDTCRQPTLHKNQIDWLCDESGLCIMDYVYKVENFELAIKEIEERTEGRLRLVNRAKNRNPNSPSKKYRELYSDRTRKIIAKRFQKDIDYFKYTF